MKKVVSILFSLALMVIMTNNVFAGEFGKIGTDKWLYLDESGTAKNRWVQNEENDWYYCGEDGYLLKNTWHHDSNGKWYYLGYNFAMLHDTTTPDGYQVGSDGAWVRDGQVVVENVEMQ
ncbi:MAG: hypothetical protein LBQ71_01470 [Hungatella sp.]|nr:hypothetical protein [Hungatella sp.]